MTKRPNEIPDLELADCLVFAPRDLKLERYDGEEMGMTAPAISK